MNAPLLFKLSLASLIGFNGLAAYWLWSVWSAPPMSLAKVSVSANSPPPAKTLKRATEGVSAKPLEAYDQIFARPVFMRARAPWEAPLPPPVVTQIDKPVPVPSPEPVHLDFKLLGIVASGSLAKIFMVEPGQSDGQWMSKGESIDGWVLTKVSTVSATFKRGQSVVKLDLFPEREDETPPKDVRKKRAPHE